MSETFAQIVERVKHLSPAEKEQLVQVLNRSPIEGTTQSAKLDTVAADPQQSLAAAQLEKLNLEIDALRNKKNWQELLVKVTPLLSVLIAVSGLLFGGYQYYSQQEKARRNERTEQQLRIQTQIRDNLNHVVSFPGDQKETISTIAFCLEDLKRLKNVLADTGQGQSADDRDFGITPVLTAVISEDCDFNKDRDVLLAFAVPEHWADYEEYLKKHPASLKTILAKYTDALGELQIKAPSYVSQLTLNDDQSEWIEPKGMSSSHGELLRHLEDLVNGFDDHLKMLEKDSPLRAGYVKAFQVATCNRTLTQTKFGISFDPKSDTKAFEDSSKLKKQPT